MKKKVFFSIFSLGAAVWLGNHGNAAAIPPHAQTIVSNSATPTKLTQTKAQAPALESFPRERSSDSSQNECTPLSLFALKSKSIPDSSLNEFYEKFEESFRTGDSRLFRSLIHPSLSRESKNPDIFNSTVEEYGLKNVELRRSFAYELHFNRRESQTAECPNGRVRGVVGPTTQVAMIHQFLGGNEQVRLFTLAAPVPISLRKDPKLDWGIVLLQAQIWSHGKQTPTALREEAQKWFLLGEPFSAWAIATAGRRILEANPYFEPNELEESQQQSARYESSKPSPDPINENLAKEGIKWKFEDSTVVFQAKSLEIGLKVRMDREEIPVNEQIQTCKHIGRIFLSLNPGIRNRFSGFECLTYLPKDNLSVPSDAGSQFHKWSDLFQK